MRRPRLRRLVLLFLCPAIPSLAQGQQPARASSQSANPSAAKPTIVESEFGKWESLGAGALSPDGKWIAYEVRRVNGNNELRYRALASDSTRVAISGEGPVFSRDGRWLAYTVGYTETERARMEKAKQPIRNKLGLVDLEHGVTTTVDDVSSFAWSGDGTRLAMRRYPAEGRKSRGADLVVRDVARGADLTLGNVAELAWSDDGARLAMIIDAESRSTNGVQQLDAATGVLKMLDAGDVTYSGLSWRKKGDDFAVLRSRMDSAYSDTGYVVLAWRGLGGAAPAKSSYDLVSDAAGPRDQRIAPYRAPLWSDDGRTVFIGIAPAFKRVKADSSRAVSDAVEPASVEVWHARDEREIPAQKIQAKADREKTQFAAWHVATNTLVRLADDSLDTVVLSAPRNAALAIDGKPYAFDGMFGRPYRDAYRIDLTTGRRERIVTKSPFVPTFSPGGRYVLYMLGGQWWTYDLTTGARANLTGALPTSFVDLEDDHPVADRAPYGTAGWSTDDRSVFLYDRFDIWEVRPDGSRPVQLTSGSEEGLVHRRLRLDPEERAIDPAKPMYLSLYGEWTKKSGFARLRPGKATERLLLLEKSTSRLVRAKDADVYTWVTQSWDDSPDWFAAGPSLNDAKQLSRTNPFQDDYAWGKSELISFTSARGVKLQGILTYPADYTPGVKYPMIVYIYEKLSQNLHSYGAPSERFPYNLSSFSQRGYFVLRPDIVFRPRDPGYSEIDAVVPAVASVIATGMIDPARVGLCGHSWGGFGSAFLATHTRIFAAAIAGAPLTNLVSMYGYTSGNTGFPETGHFEVGQERMQVPLWEDPQSYIRNSTVFHLDSLQTPLLVQFGDRDGNVNFWQGVELYNAARRLAKNVVMLVYNDENHNVAKKSSQVDYHRRQLEWFNHYLKGAPAAPWITKGQSFLEREREVKAAAPLPSSSRGGPT